MANYRLVTENPDWRFAVTRWDSRFGFGVQVEDDADGTVGEEHAVLLAVDGTELARLQLSEGEAVFGKIRAAIKKHKASQEETPAPRRAVYKGTTGDEAAAKALADFATADWSLEVTHGQQFAATEIQILAPAPDGRVIGTVPVEPRATLSARTAMVIRAHFYRGAQPADEVAATAEPAKQAPAGSAEAARAARQLGQALTPDTPAAPGPTTEIPLDLIDDLPGGNHRRAFDPEKMDELVALVREHGVVEPVLVRQEGNRYQLIAGYRRREAARRVGLTQIPAVVRKCTVADAKMTMLVENKGREDLNPMDMAFALGDLVDQDPGRHQEEIARAAGISRSTLTEYLRLRKLPEALHPAVASGAMAVKTASIFLSECEAAGLTDADRDRAAAMLASAPPSYRQAQDVIRGVISQVSHKPAARAAPTQSGGHHSSNRPASSGQNPDKRPISPDKTTAPGATNQPGNDRLVPVGATNSSVGTTTGRPETPTPRVDPNVERALALADIGREFWVKRGPENGEILFERQAYLGLEQLFELWAAWQKIGASSLPNSFGSMHVRITEQRVWFKGPEPPVPPERKGKALSVVIDDAMLTVRCGGHGWSDGAVEAVHTGKPAYYRIMMEKAHNGGNKTLFQQLVIQDGGRHIVVNGDGNAMIRQELVPKLEALVNELPAMPGG